MKEKTLWILLAVMLGVYLMLNMQVPFIIDDYVYSRSFVGISSPCDDTDPDIYIDSLSALLASVWNHIHAINGRILVVLVQQVFCAVLDKWVYDICLMVMFSTMLYLMTVRKGGQMPLREMGLCSFLLLFVFCMPGTFYEGVSVSINYVLPTVANIGFLVLWNRWRDTLDGSRKRQLMLVLVAVSAALCHENFSIPIAGALFVMLIYNRNRVGRAEVAVGMAYIAAAAMIVLAPANIQRFLMGGTSADVQLSGVTYHLMVLRYLRITYLLVLLMAVRVVRGGRTVLLGFVSENIFLLLCMVISVLFGVMIGALNGRVVYATEVFATVLLVREVSVLRIFRSHGTMLSALCMVCCTVLMASVISFQRPYVEAFRDAERQVVECRSEVCHLDCVEQDTLPPQLQKYIIVTLSPFQIEQFGWKYGVQVE